MKLIVICVFPLTDQVELREISSGKRFYYKHKERTPLLKSLQPRDIVNWNLQTQKLERSA